MTNGTAKKRWLKWTAILLTVIVLAAIALFVWYVWIRDSPDPLDEGDLDEALNQTTPTPVGTAPTALTGTAPDTPTTPAPAAPVTTAVGDPGTAAPPAAGAPWAVVPEASTVGY